MPVLGILCDDTTLASSFFTDNCTVKCQIKCLCLKTAFDKNALLSNYCSQNFKSLLLFDLYQWFKFKYSKTVLYESSSQLMNESDGHWNLQQDQMTMRKRQWVVEVGAKEFKFLIMLIASWSEMSATRTLISLQLPPASGFTIILFSTYWMNDSFAIETFFRTSEAMYIEQVEHLSGVGKKHNTW